MTRIGSIKHMLDQILGCIEKHPVFSFYTVRKEIEVMDSHHYTFLLQIQPGTYVSAVFSMRPILFPKVVEDSYGPLVEAEEEGKETLALSVAIPSLFSDLGHGMGFFLLHLVMTLAVACHAVEITLDNDTDDPPRAARGIYRLFLPDVRGALPPYSLREAMAERCHVVGPDSMRCIRDSLLERVQSELRKKEERARRREETRGREETREPWREDAVETIRRLFQERDAAGSTFTCSLTV